MGIGRSANDLLRKLKAAQFVEQNGGSLSTNWTPGEETPGIDLVGKLIIFKFKKTLLGDFLIYDIFSYVIIIVLK